MAASIDLRSDTVTKPTPAMRTAMAEADVADDVLMEDPTVNELQRYAAELTGQEDALFVTSGTQGNLVSLLTHCNRGDGAIMGKESHIYYYEAGGMAALGGIQPLVVDDSSGMPSAAAVGLACREPNVHYAPARLLCLENTHNRCGGIAIPVAEFAAVVSTARDHGLAVHLDGARVLNAATKWDVDVREYTAGVDSVQICLSKGLGAPIGSLICASREFVDTARHWRKRVGGGMRQAGVVAAPGLVALRDMRLRLGEDHENAELFARTLADGGVKVEESPWRTNMVFFSVRDGADREPGMDARCAARGVLFLKIAENRFRAVMHADVSREQVAAAAGIIVEVAG